MKRTGNIASLFERHAQKTGKKASMRDVQGTADVAEEQTREFVVQEQTQETVLSMSNVTVEQTTEPMVGLEDVSPPPPVYDFGRLRHDPGERPPIASYPINDQDAVRRAYILKGAFKPYAHNFEARRIGNRVRSFGPFWLHKHSGLGNLVDLSVKLVQTGRHIVHNFVYLLLKLVLILPVATANVERAFSAMSLVKSKLRNKMGDSLLNDFLVTYIERDIFSKVNEDDIIDTFVAIQKCRPET